MPCIRLEPLLTESFASFVALLLNYTEVKNPVTGARMFCGYIRDMTEVNLYRNEKKRQDRLIQDQFFQNAAASTDNSGGGRRSPHNGGGKRSPRRFRKSQSADQ